jgi:two-component system, OmpR family, sensor kinase
MMKQKIRTRYFGWLAVILFLFFMLNSLILLGVNLPEILAKGPAWKDEVAEWLIVTATGFLALPIALAAAWKISAWMLDPLRNVIRTANHIEAGHFSERVVITGAQDEIAELASSLNRALDRYQDAMDRLQQFNGTASHQLRTPLATIRTRGEVALQKERTTDEYRETLETMLEVCETLERAVEQLLMMSRIRDEDIVASFRPIRIAPLFESLLLQYEPLFASRNLQIIQHVDPALHVEANPDLLLQALANLFDNAIRHSPAEGSIILAANLLPNGMVELSVTDRGEGLPKAYTSGSKIQRIQQQGRGLGLLIVETILQKHGGHVEYANATEGGACIRLRLPQMQAKPHFA